MRAHREVPAGSRPLAHDRFRQRSRQWSWIGISLAALLHFAVLAFAPPIRVHYWRAAAPQKAEIRAVRLLHGIRTPPEAPKITPPAPPILSSIEPLIDVAIAPIELEVAPLPVMDIPPPPMPEALKDEFAGFVHFMPMMVKPELLNRDEVRRRLKREYPLSLQSAGIGGVVMILFWIDEKGTVRKWELSQSSGKKGLDRAAERVVPHMKFRPAIKLGEPVKVIVALPIRFESY